LFLVRMNLRVNLGCRMEGERQATGRRAGRHPWRQPVRQTGHRPGREGTRRTRVAQRQPRAVYQNVKREPDVQRKPLFVAKKSVTQIQHARRAGFAKKSTSKPPRNVAKKSTTAPPRTRNVAKKSTTKQSRALTVAKKSTTRREQNVAGPSMDVRHGPYRHNYHRWGHAKVCQALLEVNHDLAEADEKLQEKRKETMDYEAKIMRYLAAKAVSRELYDTVYYPELLTMRAGVSVLENAAERIRQRFDVLMDVRDRYHQHERFELMDACPADHTDE